MHKYMSINLAYISTLEIKKNDAMFVMTSSAIYTAFPFCVQNCVQRLGNP